MVSNTYLTEKVVSNTYLTEKVPASNLAVVGDSGRPYEKIVEYFRAVGEVVSGSHAGSEDVYVFQLRRSSTQPMQKVIVRGWGEDHCYVDVDVIGVNASAIAKNLVTLVGGRDGK